MIRSGQRITEMKLGKYKLQLLLQQQLRNHNPTQPDADSPDPDIVESSDRRHRLRNSAMKVVLLITK